MHTLIKKYHTLFGVALAFIITILAGWIAITISADYYSVAPFHFDSAAYRLESAELHEVFNKSGFLDAFKRIIHGKDELDNLLRLVAAPNLLLGTYGHLGVLLPFMALFLSLIFSFIYNRSQSFFASCVGVLVVFIFPIIYDPYTGIADFWKDNIGAWLLGSALIAWFRAENLQHRSWAVISGLLLGLLAMQRTALAVYAAFLFLPILLLTFSQQTHKDGVKITFHRFLFFLFPVVLMGSLVGILQWRTLYNYYFVAGYAYGTTSQALMFLISLVSARFGYPQLIFWALIVVFSISTLSSKLRVGSLVMLGWIIMGLPLIVIASKGQYNLFMNVWTVLLMVSLSLALTIKVPISRWRIRFLSLSVFFIIVASWTQYTHSVTQAHKMAKENLNLRRFWEELTDTIMAQPPPHRVSLLFYEAEMLFKSHLIFNRNLSDNMVFVGDFWIHDTYYKAHHPGLSLPQLIELNTKRIEESDGTLAIAYSEPEAVVTSPFFYWDGKNVAVPYAKAISYHLLNSPNWKPINILDSPYGNLYVYKYSRNQLTEAERWRDLQGIKSAYSVPLDFLQVPGVKLYSYYCSYLPEMSQGKYAQRLPSGRLGLQWVLYSDRARMVTFSARAIPESAKSDTVRTLLLGEGQRTLAKVAITKEQDIEVIFTLQPGLNRLNFSIAEEANVPSIPNGDTRQLMLLITSPKLVSTSEGALQHKSNIVKGGL